MGISQICRREKIMNFLLIFISFLLFLSVTNAQEERSVIRNGNSKYENKQFEEAEIKYRKSLEIAPDSKEAKFNLGGSLYKQEKYENAIEDYQEMSSRDLAPKELASTFHNLGNSLLKSGKIEESLEAYKEAMKLDPEDSDTKYNYSYARQMLKKQQEQQKQDKNKDQENKDDKKDNKKDDKDKQDQKDKDKDGDKSDKKDSDENSDEQKDKQDQSKSGDDKKENKKDEKQKQGADSKPLKISPKDAERMLQALAKQEKETQKKLRKLKKKSQNIEKNW